MLHRREPEFGLYSLRGGGGERFYVNTNSNKRIYYSCFLQFEALLPATPSTTFTFRATYQRNERSLTRLPVGQPALYSAPQIVQDLSRRPQDRPNPPCKRHAGLRFKRRYTNIYIFISRFQIDAVAPLSTLNLPSYLLFLLSLTN